MTIFLVNVALFMYLSCTSENLNCYSQYLSLLVSQDLEEQDPARSVLKIEWSRIRIGKIKILFWVHKTVGWPVGAVSFRNMNSSPLRFVDLEKKKFFVLQKSSYKVLRKRILEFKKASLNNIIVQTLLVQKLSILHRSLTAYSKKIL